MRNAVGVRRFAALPSPQGINPHKDTVKRPLAAVPACASTMHPGEDARIRWQSNGAVLPWMIRP